MVAITEIYTSPNYLCWSINIQCTCVIRISTTRLKFSRRHLQLISIGPDNSLASKEATHHYLNQCCCRSLKHISSLVPRVKPFSVGDVAIKCAPHSLSRISELQAMITGVLRTITHIILISHIVIVFDRSLEGRRMFDATACKEKYCHTMNQALYGSQLKVDCQTKYKLIPNKVQTYTIFALLKQFVVSVASLLSFISRIRVFLWYIYACCCYPSF